jgi:high-affinity K+ transport system ATPase subunit B
MNKLFGRANDPLNLVVAIAEIVAGVIVFAGVFFAVQSRLLYGATLVIAILWIIQIILSFFASNFAEPDLVVWINRLAADLIVLLSLWLINRKYA